MRFSASTKPMVATHFFDISYKSPVHVIAHRQLNNDPTSGQLEFLSQFNTEIGPAFVWEP
jgi:hypothetical protein